MSLSRLYPHLRCCRRVASASIWMLRSANIRTYSGGKKIYHVIGLREIWTTTSRHHNITTSQHRDITTSRHHNITTSRRPAENLSCGVWAGRLEKPCLTDNYTRHLQQKVRNKYRPVQFNADRQCRTGQQLWSV